MRRTVTFTLTGFVGFFLLALAFTGDASSQTGAAKKLPTYWDKLKLSKDQQEKVFKIQDEHQAKVDKLQKELKALEAQKRKDLYGVLDDTQKKEIVKTYLEKTGIDPFADPKGKAGATGKDKK